MHSLDREHVTPPSVTVILLGSLVVLGASGCRPETNPLSWRVELGDASGRATAVRVAVLAGGCDGAEIVGRWVGRGEMPVGTLTRLDPGAYGVSARAIDVACVRIAADCEPVTLPVAAGAAPLVLSLVSDDSGVEECDDCRAGRCAEPLDAGSMPDGAPSDTRPPLDTSTPPDARDSTMPPVDTAPSCGALGTTCCATSPACDTGLVCAAGTCSLPPSCPPATDCANCLAEKGCGHCRDDGSCRPGDQTGPLTGSCNAWIGGLVNCDCTTERGVSCTNFRQCCGPSGGCRVIEIGQTRCCSEGGGACASESDCCGQMMPCVAGTCRCLPSGEGCFIAQDCCSGGCNDGSCD
jgi:hypothetical protein